MIRPVRRVESGSTGWKRALSRFLALGALLWMAALHADSLAQDFADILLLQGDLLALSPARLAAERRLGELRADYRTVYLANLGAVAGGFLAGFSR